jgi:hypothetical protein
VQKIMSFQKVDPQYLESLAQNVPSRGAKSIVPWSTMTPGDVFVLEGDLKRARALVLSATSRKYGVFTAVVDAEKFGDAIPRVICLSRAEAAPPSLPPVELKQAA